MTKIQRVKKVQLWPVWKIAAAASIMGLITVSLMFGFTLASQAAFGQNLGQTGDVAVFALGILGPTLLFGFPAMVAIHYHPRFRRWWHGFLFGATYGLMGSFTGVFGMYQYVRYGVRSANFPTFLIPTFLITVRAGLLISMVTGLLFVLLWAVSRKTRGKLLITDKTYCPDCGYNLVGNTTHICPECGRSFTLEELEINSEDLQPHGQE